jgi:hypothetical protein
VILGVFLQEHTKENITPMALSQSVVSELLDAFRAGDGVDLIRESVRLVLQELIEVEATREIGAAPHERTETRTNDRRAQLSTEDQPRPHHAAGHCHPESRRSPPLSTAGALPLWRRFRLRA